MQNNIETEIKLILKDINIDDLIKEIEVKLGLKMTPIFHQVTHQFFEEDFTKQIAYPRVRNEEDGSTTLTVKAKFKNEENSEYFKRLELESQISEVNNVIQMMPFFGFNNTITWEKKRNNFASMDNTQKNFKLSLDETPMGFFLEIESDENKIENIIQILNLTHLARSNKSYLGLWDVYKKDHKILSENMMFNISPNSA